MKISKELAAQLGGGGVTADSQPASVDQGDLGQESASPAEVGEVPVAEAPEAAAGPRPQGKGAQKRIQELSRRAKGAEAENSELRDMVKSLVDKVDNLTKPRYSDMIAETMNQGGQEVTLSAEDRLRHARTIAENEILRTYPDLPEEVIETAIERRVAFVSRGIPMTLKEIVASACVANDFDPKAQDDGSQGDEMDNTNNQGMSPSRRASVSSTNSGRSTQQFDPNAALAKQREDKFNELGKQLSNSRLHQRDRRNLFMERMQQLGF